MKYQYFKYTVTYSHVIILEPANQERLLQMEKYAILQDEVREWLNENIGFGNWTHEYGCISFKSKEDAMAFKMRWA